MSGIVTEQLYLDNLSMIQNIAGTMIRKFNCKYLLEDLVSTGTVAFLERFIEYDETTGATLSTYLYPHIKGAMLREIERNFGAMAIPKREFHEYRKNRQLSTLRSVPMDKPTGDEDNNLMECLPSAEVPPDQQIYTQICLEHMREAFDKLSFKERQILGGYFEVYGHEKRTLANIGEEFCIKEEAARKAKDKALEKLRRICIDGDFGYWVSICSAIWDSRQEWAAHARGIGYKPQLCCSVQILALQVQSCLEHRQKGSMVQADTECGMRSLALWAVLYQLQDGDAVTRMTLFRLMSTDYDVLSAMERIAAVLLEEVYYILKYRHGFCHRRYARKLRYLE